MLLVLLVLPVWLWLWLWCLCYDGKVATVHGAFDSTHSWSGEAGPGVAIFVRPLYNTSA